MNPLFRIDFSISDSLKIVRKSVLIYETIILRGCILQSPHTSAKEKLPSKAVSAIQSNAFGYPETAGYSIG